MKFCTECGFQLEDNAVFCTKCGSQQENSQATIGEGAFGAFNNSRPEEVTQDSVYEQYHTYQQSQNTSDNSDYQQQYFSPNAFETNNSVQNSSYQESYNRNGYGQGSFGQPPLKKKSKAPAIIGVSVVIVAVIAMVIGMIYMTFGGGANSAKGAAEGFLKAYCEFDGKKMVKYIAYSSEYNEEINDFAKEFDDNKSYASLIDMSYKIKSTKKISGSDAEDFWDEYGYDIYVDKSDVKNLTEVKVSITMSALGEKETNDMSIYVGKYKGKWKVIYTGWY